MERKTDRYTSHDIQNKILKLMSISVIWQLANDIRSGQCNFFSLIADEYTEISNLEQLTTCFRWIDEHLDSHEDFVGFYHMPNTVASTIESVLKDVLIRLQLSLNECRGQCYNGASNMLAKKSGVATQIKEIQPKAYATHCHCHSLSLSVKDARKGSKILTDAVEITKEIVQLIKLSPKREQMLGVIKDKLESETDENEEVESCLAKFSATRWTVRAVCFKRIFKNYQVLQETWKQCLKQGGLSAEINSTALRCGSFSEKSLKKSTCAVMIRIIITFRNQIFL